MDSITINYQDININKLKYTCIYSPKRNQEIGYFTYNEEILLIQIPYFNSGDKFCKHNLLLESLIILPLENINVKQNEFINKIYKIENIINTDDFIQKYLNNNDCVFVSCISNNKLLHMKLKYTYNNKILIPSFIIYEKVNEYNHICEIKDKLSVNKYLNNKNYESIVKINVRTKTFLNKLYYGIELQVVKIRYI
jgi:hypothetical protein